MTADGLTVTISMNVGSKNGKEQLRSSETPGQSNDGIETQEEIVSFNITTSPKFHFQISCNFVVHL